jgi:hypothetical protein
MLDLPDRILLNQRDGKPEVFSYFMIIWRGHGILIPVFAFAGGACVSSLAKSAHLPPSPSLLWGGMAAGSWLYALTLGRPSVRILVDPQSGTPVRFRRSHSLYFIPPMIWAVLATGVALFVAFADLTGADSGNRASTASAAATRSPASKGRDDSRPASPVKTTSDIVEPPQFEKEAAKVPAPVAMSDAVTPRTSADLPTAMRDWKDTSGRPLRASLVRFVGADRKTAEFRRDDGRSFQIPVEKFSSEDQAFIQALPGE